MLLIGSQLSISIIDVIVWKWKSYYCTRLPMVGSRHPGRYFGSKVQADVYVCVKVVKVVKVKESERE